MTAVKDSMVFFLTPSLSLVLVFWVNLRVRAYQVCKTKMFYIRRTLVYPTKRFISSRNCTLLSTPIVSYLKSRCCPLEERIPIMKPSPLSLDTMSTDLETWKISDKKPLSFPAKNSVFCQISDHCSRHQTLT